jgi:TOBE domain
MSGIVEEVIFVGNDTQYLIRVGQGNCFMMRRQNQTPVADAPMIQANQTVIVCWSAASTNLLLK